MIQLHLLEFYAINLAASAQELSRGRSYRHNLFCDCRLASLESDVQQLKATNEPEATYASKFTSKNSALLVNNDITCASQVSIINVTCANQEPIITTSTKQVSQHQLRVQKQLPSLDKGEFQLVQYKKRNVYVIRKDVKPTSEPRIASLHVCLSC